MTHKAVLRRDDISEFITQLYGGDLHAKRVLSLANATLGVLTSTSLAVHAIGQGLAQAMGKLSKHGIKQVDRLLSNEAIDVQRFFGYWVVYEQYMVGARVEIDVVELRDPDHRFALAATDFASVNPNTDTAPIFRTRRDAELTTAIYRRLPVLVDRSGGEEVRTWPVKYATMFHMTWRGGPDPVIRALFSTGVFIGAARTS